MVVMNELYDIDLHFDFLPFSLRSVVTAGELLESHFLDQASPSYSSGGQFFQANEFFDCPNAQAKHCGCLTFGKQELFTHCGYPLQKFPRTPAVCCQVRFDVSHTSTTDFVARVLPLPAGISAVAHSEVAGV